MAIRFGSNLLKEEGQVDGNGLTGLRIAGTVDSLARKHMARMAKNMRMISNKYRRRHQSAFYLPKLCLHVISTTFLEVVISLSPDKRTLTTAKNRANLRHGF